MQMLQLLSGGYVGDLFEICFSAHLIKHFRGILDALHVADRPAGILASGILIENAIAGTRSLNSNFGLILISNDQKSYP